MYNQIWDNRLGPWYNEAEINEALPSFLHTVRKCLLMRASVANELSDKLTGAREVGESSAATALWIKRTQHRITTELRTFASCFVVSAREASRDASCRSSRAGLLPDFIPVWPGAAAHQSGWKHTCYTQSDCGLMKWQQKNIFPHLHLPGLRYILPRFGLVFLTFTHR